MTRLAPLALALAALTGCYDFTGEAGRLGFSSDATVDGHTPWTPAHALAAGARPTLAVTEIVASGDEPTSTRLETSRSLVAHPDEGAFVIAGEDGWIGAEADGVRDDLHVRFRRARGASFVDPASILLGEALELTDVAVLRGEPTPVGLIVVERDGSPLGWVPDQLDVRVDGPLTLGTDDSLELVADGPARVRASWGNGRAATLDVHVVGRADVAAGRVLELETPDGCVAIARFEVDGVPVLVGDGVSWAHTDEDDNAVECAPDGTLPPTLRPAP